MKTKVSLRDGKDLSLAYSPGVADLFKEIVRSQDSVYDYIMQKNLVVGCSQVLVGFFLGHCPLSASHWTKAFGIDAFSPGNL